MKRKKNPGKNTKIAIVFFVIILFVVFLSLLHKAILLISESKFDGDHRFNILVWNKKNIKVLSFSPSEDKITILRIQGEKGGIDIYKFLEIPLDAHISTDYNNFNKNIKQLLIDVILDSRTTKSDLNVVDIVKLWLLQMKIKDIKEEVLPINLDEEERDKILLSLFEEDRIASEKINIEIINSTEESGLGNRIARLVSNIGGNVMLVSTSQNQEEKSVLFYKKEKSFTFERLKKILPFPIEENKQGIGDIIIRLGRDYNQYIGY